MPRAKFTRSSFDRNEFEKALAEADPFKAERQVLLNDPDPCVRICGRIAGCWGLIAAQLLEKVEPDTWEAWIAVPKNYKQFEYARRLAKGLLEAESRSLALGVASRRGQTVMLKRMMMDGGPPVEQRSKMAGYIAQEPNGVPSLHGRSEDDLKRLAGEEDEED